MVHDVLVHMYIHGNIIAVTIMICYTQGIRISSTVWWCFDLSTQWDRKSYILAVYSILCCYLTNLDI